MWVVKNLWLSLAILGMLSSPCYGKIIKNTKTAIAKTLSEKKELQNNFFNSNLTQELKNPICQKYIKDPLENFTKNDFIIIKKCNDGLYRLALYKKWKLNFTSLCSPGKKWHPSKIWWPFKIGIKDKDHKSNSYNTKWWKLKKGQKWASMPYAIQIDNSPYYIHGGNTNGQPLSHWCFRLPFEIAKKLFELVWPDTNILSVIK